MAGGSRAGSTEPFVSVPTIPRRLLGAFFKPSEHVAEAPGNLVEGTSDLRREVSLRRNGARERNPEL